MLVLAYFVNVTTHKDRHFHNSPAHGPYHMELYDYSTYPPIEPLSTSSSPHHMQSFTKACQFSLQSLIHVHHDTQWPRSVLISFDQEEHNRPVLFLSCSRFTLFRLPFKLLPEWSFWTLPLSPHYTQLLFSALRTKRKFLSMNKPSPLRLDTT